MKLAVITELPVHYPVVQDGGSNCDKIDWLQASQLYFTVDISRIGIPPKVANI